MEKIGIRPQQIKDAKDFYRILTSGNFEFFPVNVASIEAEKRFLRKNVTEFKSGKNYNFAILLADKLVGAIGIMPEASRPYNAEIGYFIDREYHGRGIAFKAVQLAEEFAKEELPELNRLQAIMVVENFASARVAEKAGFHREGILKKYLKVGTCFHDAFIYGKVIR